MLSWTVCGSKIGRRKKYFSNAARQRAYRQRMKEQGRKPATVKERRARRKVDRVLTEADVDRHIESLEGEEGR